MDYCVVVEVHFSFLDMLDVRLTALVVRVAVFGERAGATGLVSRADCCVRRGVSRKERRAREVALCDEPAPLRYRACRDGVQLSNQLVSRLCRVCLEFGAVRCSPHGTVFREHNPGCVTADAI